MVEMVDEWELLDRTTNDGGYLRLTFRGRRVCDFFPFAANEDQQWIREKAKIILQILNGELADIERLQDALSQLVGWVEECGSDHEGREYCLTEARAAPKGLKIVRAPQSPHE